MLFVEQPASNGGPRGSKGVGEPPIVPTAGAVGNAIAIATGAPRPAAADDARAGLASGHDRRRRRRRAERAVRRRARRRAAASRPMTTRFAAPTTLEDALGSCWPPIAAARPVAGGTDLVVAARQGRTRPAGIDRRDRPDRRARPARGRRRMRSFSARSTSHDWLAESPDGRGWMDGARRRVRDRRIAGHPRNRHDRRQPDERVAGGRDHGAAWSSWTRA